MAKKIRRRGVFLFCCRPRRARFFHHVRGFPLWCALPREIAASPFAGERFINVKHFYENPRKNEKTKRNSQK
ncbi:hypothetical protein [Synergistes jonesii]|uniref:hypothetical protein n=1 Tax=Synergistes jonesii TaxID=2754 RepID=UPI00248F3733|nr:hypothetical protein [Synergistes jonesii]